MPNQERTAGGAPIHTEERNVEQPGIKDEIALCLSGGGYRAMVFHLGCLIRLNEVGLLGQLKRVSSVSGGSITAAVLGLKWKELRFQDGVASNLEIVLDPVRKLAGETIDRGSILGGLAVPGVSISDLVEKAYKKYLFGEATLQDLPADSEGPRFVINATNVQTGVLWRFSRPYMGDYKVGLVKNPRASIASAVAASSAFPPVLSPARLEAKQSDFEPTPGATLQEPPFTTDIFLADGGVYDNLGLETAFGRCRTLLVSDGGGKMQPDPKPKSDWASHALRINDIIDNQVRSLRKRQLIEAFRRGTEHTGAYWGIRSDVRDYPKPGALDCPVDHVEELASIATRLKALDEKQQQRLMNWSYAICSAAVESYVSHPVDKPARFPFTAGV